MTGSDDEAADSVSVALCIVLYDWHVIVCHGAQGPVGLVVGRRRLPAGGRGGRGRRGLRAHAARAQLPIGTDRTLSHVAAPPHFVSGTFRLRCSTIYDLHTNGLLWCFVWIVLLFRRVSTIRFADCIAGTKTQTNLVCCLAYVYIIVKSTHLNWTFVLVLIFVLLILLNSSWRI